MQRSLLTDRQANSNDYYYLTHASVLRVNKKSYNACVNHRKEEHIVKTCQSHAELPLKDMRQDLR